MFDELERLGADEDLRRLLTHYAQAGEADREVWQDRLMELEGVESSRLIRLHGLLLAFGFVEQNTGAVSALRANVVPQCYRISLAGRRAIRRSLLGEETADASAAEQSGAGCTSV
jgi:hypothetical protein